MVMEELRHLDEVGYVRFASVYRSFQDAEAFREPRSTSCAIIGGAANRVRRISCRCCRATERQEEMSAEPASTDRLQMGRALELAARGLYTTDPNPRVGCVLVRDGTRASARAGTRAGEPHAEVLALRAAGRRRAARRPT
jgi:hypothetical protein